MLNTPKWYAWIPTNLGILNYDFITKEQVSSAFGKKVIFPTDNKVKRFCNLSLKDFNDSLSSYFRASDENEIIPIGTIHITY